MSNIRKLQQQYLETGADEILAEIYKGLFSIGVKISKAEEKVSQDMDDVHDIASGVCIRLIEKRQPVINCAPSAYMKMALFYKNKALLHDSIDDHQLGMKPKARSCDSEVDDIIEALDIDVTTDAGALAEQTLRSRANCHKVKRSITDPETRKEYGQIMKEVYNYEKGRVQGSRLLQNH